MSIKLSNPKTFLPLLLFAGFVVALMGMGFESITNNSTLVFDGFVIMTIAVVLFILMNRRKMGI